MMGGQSWGMIPNPDTSCICPNPGTWIDDVYETRGLGLSLTASSGSQLYKDENNVFYSVSVTVSSGGVKKLYVNKYDGNNDIGAFYDCTFPTQLLDFYIGYGYGRTLQWHIWKKSETEIDFVVHGKRQSASTGLWQFQHYKWTIGSTTLTYQGNYEYSTPNWTTNSWPVRVTFGDYAYYLTNETTGTSIDRILMCYRYNMSTDTGESIILHTINAIPNGINHGNKYWWWSHFPAGTKLYLAVLWNEVTSTEVCTCYIWPPSTHSTGQNLNLTLVDIDPDGTINSGNTVIAQADQFGAGFTGLSIRHGFGADDEGNVYCRISYGRDYDGPTECVFCLYGNINPGRTEHNWRYIKIAGGAVSTYANWILDVVYGTDITGMIEEEGNYASPKYWGTSSSTLINSGWDKYVIGRGDNHPLGIFVHQEYYYYWILDWVTLEYSSQLVIPPYYNWAHGHIPDNHPVVTGEIQQYIDGYGTAEVMYFADGSAYGMYAKGNIDHVSFYMGRFPVYTLSGEYRIFGPAHLLEDLRPRWQVV